MNVTVLLDSRFRGNDTLFYFVIIERLGILFGSKTVSLSKELQIKTAIKSNSAPRAAAAKVIRDHFSYPATSGC